MHLLTVRSTICLLHLRLAVFSKSMVGVVIVCFGFLVRKGIVVIAIGGLRSIERIALIMSERNGLLDAHW